MIWHRSRPPTRMSKLNHNNRARAAQARAARAAARAARAAARAAFQAPKAAQEEQDERARIICRLRPRVNAASKSCRVCARSCLLETLKHPRTEASTTSERPAEDLEQPTTEGCCCQYCELSAEDLEMLDIMPSCLGMD
jgi:hypothetical protein